MKTKLLRQAVIDAESGCRRWVAGNVAGRHTVILGRRYDALHHPVALPWLVQRYDGARLLHQWTYDGARDAFAHISRREPKRAP